MSKQFRLRADQIKRVLPPIGGCIASDRITVGGDRVGFMYRDDPRMPEDSGWRFVAGDETDEYLDDPRNCEIYDVNTIANYDPVIIPYLDAPIGAAFVRDLESDTFIPES